MSGPHFPAPESWNEHSLYTAPVPARHRHDLALLSTCTLRDRRSFVRSAPWLTSRARAAGQHVRAAARWAAYPQGAQRAGPVPVPRRPYLGDEVGQRVVEDVVDHVPQSEAAEQAAQIQLRTTTTTR